MNIGMLWFDNDKGKTLTQKVVDAATYYRDKYGAAPNYCEVHPGPDVPKKVGKIRIVANRTILPNHLWIGVDVANSPVAT